MIRELRHAIYRAKYVHGPKLPLRSPVDVSLELASACNMACSYCYHGDKKNLPFTMGIMSWATIERIVTSAAEAGVHSLKFNYRGESTLNPNYARATTLARSLAKGSTFIDRITNSNFKFDSTKKEIFLGLANQTKVKVSLDSFDANVFHAQRVGGCHHTTMQNIDLFHTYFLDPTRTELVIQAVRTTANKDEPIAEMVAERWPLAKVSIRDMVAGRTAKDVSELENKTRDTSERQSCVQAHVRLMFDWTGKAGVCCPDIGSKIRVGDIYRSSVKEIFNSQEARAIRRDLKSGAAFKAEPCKGCSSFESYKGYTPNWNS